MPNHKRIYDDRFFQGKQESSISSAREVVPLIMELVRPNSVIDVGCGFGEWALAFAQHAVSDHMGIDGGWVNTNHLLIDKEKFRAVDLTKPFLMDRTFDLAVCLEVAEHLPADCAGVLVQSLVRLAPLVLFSAAIPFQGGRNHMNEQWPEYWADLFFQEGYIVIDCVRNKIWNNKNVSTWYAQNMLIFAKEGSLDVNQVLYAEYQKFLRFSPPLSIIHPLLYKRKAFMSNPENLPLKKILGAVPGVLKRAILFRLGKLSNFFH